MHVDDSIAIITARGGSKRIPRKNIKEFLGYPIIKYSIEAALKAGCFEDVIVSTDDEEIASIARSLGANVPFLRSKENANDYATTADVISEVLGEYGKLGQVFDNFCCLYPTAPFVTAEKLQAASQLLAAPDTNSVITVTKFDFPILRSFNITNGFLEMNWPQYETARSQDLEIAYHDCGQFYFVKTAHFLHERKLYSAYAKPFIVDEMESQDIDNESDWMIAEIKYKLMVK